MIDSNLPRFSQGVLAVVLAIAFLLDARVLVAIAAGIFVVAALGGPRANLLAYLYRALPLPAGDLEPAGPPRFSQSLGAVFLTVSTIALFTFERATGPWWTLGWGAALMVAVLAGMAAATSF